MSTSTYRSPLMVTAAVLMIIGAIGAVSALTQAFLTGVGGETIMPFSSGADWPAGVAPGIIILISALGALACGVTALLRSSLAHIAGVVGIVLAVVAACLCLLWWLAARPDSGGSPGAGLVMSVASFVVVLIGAVSAMLAARQTTSW